jgi:hypothetical protein
LEKLDIRQEKIRRKLKDELITISVKAKSMFKKLYDKKSIEEQQFEDKLQRLMNKIEKPDKIRRKSKMPSTSKRSGKNKKKS